MQGLSKPFCSFSMFSEPNINDASPLLRCFGDWVSRRHGPRMRESPRQTERSQASQQNVLRGSMDRVWMDSPNVRPDRLEFHGGEKSLSGCPKECPNSETLSDARQPSACQGTSRPGPLSENPQQKSSRRRCLPQWADTSRSATMAQAAQAAQAAQVAQVAQVAHPHTGQSGMFLNVPSEDLGGDRRTSDQPGLTKTGGLTEIQALTRIVCGPTHVEPCPANLTCFTLCAKKFWDNCSSIWGHANKHTIALSLLPLLCLRKFLHRNQVSTARS